MHLYVLNKYTDMKSTWLLCFYAFIAQKSFYNNELQRIYSEGTRQTKRCGFRDYDLHLGLNLLHTRQLRVFLRNHHHHNHVAKIVS